MALPIDPGAFLLGFFFILIFLRVPIAVALGLAGIVVNVLTQMGTTMFAPVFFANISKFSLLAIPYFILAGVLMGRSGISDKIIRLISLMVGNIRGGLAVVTVITAMFWGAVSGSGPATVAALGTILIPGMVKADYDRSFAAALMSASSGIAIIIPPSIAFVVYGVITGASISTLFLAGIIPGIVVGLCLIVAAYLISIKRNYGGQGGGNLREVWQAFKEAFWGLFAPVIILGGIYGGVFTPTEAAAVAVFYGLFVGVVIYRTIDWQTIYRILVESCISSATVMLVVAFAGIFGWAMTALGVVEKVSQAAIAITSNEIPPLNHYQYNSFHCRYAAGCYFHLLPLTAPFDARHGPLRLGPNLVRRHDDGKPGHRANNSAGGSEPVRGRKHCRDFHGRDISGCNAFCNCRASQPVTHHLYPCHNAAATKFDSKVM
jgi:C4-dicarboxylate transporter DctM subunit